MWVYHMEVFAATDWLCVDLMMRQLCAEELYRIICSKYMIVQFEYSILHDYMKLIWMIRDYGLF